MLTSCVAKRSTITTFVVEPTNYGWPVCAGTKRMGLFVTQRQALEEAKKAACRTYGEKANVARSL